MGRIPGVFVWIPALLLTGCACFWAGRHTVSAQKNAAAVTPESVNCSSPDSRRPEPTRLYAHNLLLRKGAHFRIYVRWIRGEMLPTRPDRNPSFDAPDSFVLEIQKGIITAKLNDIADFLNQGTSGDAPLKNISIQSADGHLQLRGTAHKLIPLPIQLDGELSSTPDGRLKYHLVKLNVLKIPVRGLLGAFHFDLSDFVKNIATPGVNVSGNDVYFDTQRLLPPPHIHGNITSVITSGTDLKLVYGGANEDEGRLAQWHNFLRLSGGSLDFGKLTMRQVDLTMIDASDDPWFDLDLVNYQAQLVYGTTRLTEKAGLEIYMPDVDNLPPKGASQAVSLEWLRNRNTSPPLDLPGH